MVEESELGKKDNLGKSPIHLQNKLHSQFSLKHGKYRDNNNYITYNTIFTQDNRFWPYVKKKQYNYLSFTQ